MRLAALPACACTASATVGPGSRSRRVSGLVDGPARVGGAPLSRRRPASHQPPPPPARRPARPTPTRPLPSTVVPPPPPRAAPPPHAPPPSPRPPSPSSCWRADRASAWARPRPSSTCRSRASPWPRTPWPPLPRCRRSARSSSCATPPTRACSRSRWRPSRPRPPIAWASPGAERQDSVCNGLAAADPRAALVAVHDSARPVVSPADVRRCLADGAAVRRGRAGRARQADHQGGQRRRHGRADAGARPPVGGADAPSDSARAPPRRV